MPLGPVTPGPGSIRDRLRRGQLHIPAAGVIPAFRCRPVCTTIQTPSDEIDTVGALRAYLRACGATGAVLPSPRHGAVAHGLDDGDCLCGVDVGATLARASIPYRYDPSEAWEFATTYDPSAQMDGPPSVPAPHTPPADRQQP